MIQEGDSIIKTMSNRLLSDRGLDLVLDYEVGGSDGVYYNKFLKHPTVPAWQTTQSGVTIGIGWDAGYNTPTTLNKEWGEFLSVQNIKSLEKVLGLKSSNAYNNLYQVKNISIEWEIAKNQFLKYTIPRFYNLTSKVFPNFEIAPTAIKDALVSLVFNRGGSLRGNSRKEMREIHRLMSLKQWDKISAEFRKMKRLWPNVKGVLKRREAEAKFIDDNL